MAGRTLTPAGPTGTVGSMKIDGGISGAGTGGLAAIGESARQLEDAGYAGAWTAETSHDPFLPHMLAAEHTERIELGGLYTLEYGDGDPDTSVATVFIAANEEVGGYSVVMQYLDPS